MVESTNLTTDKDKEKPELAAPAATASTGTSPQNPAAAQEAALKEPEKEPAKAPELPKHDRKEAKGMFNAFNFLGLHWVGNSALSLWITYNIVPRPSTQKFLHSVAKGMTPMVESFDKLKTAVGLSKLSGLSKEVRANQITQSARSFTEVACMCFAGSIILLPVKWLEDHRPQILRYTDELIHPGHKRERLAAEAEAKKNGLPPPKEPDDGHRKETWGNLIRARALALVPIFWIDGQMEAFNNARATRGKPNINTWEWQLGTHTYDNMKPTLREKIVNFFSSKGIKLSKVQHLVRDELLETVGAPEELKNIGKEMTKIQSNLVVNGHDAAVAAAGNARIAELEADIIRKNLVRSTEKAIFAEQTRMFSKEVSLSLIYTGFLFILGKTNIVPWTMQKLGLSKKDAIGLTDAIETDVGNLDVFSLNNPNGNGKGHQHGANGANGVPASGNGHEAAPAEAPPAPAAAGGFASRIKPKAPPTASPSELYTQKLADKELSGDSRTWDRSTI